jgi:quercetin dioxygenase-like cupin family protein
MPNTFSALWESSPYQIWDHAIARVISGQRVTVAVVDIEPNQILPEHRHPNEQVGLVLEGIITMVIAGERKLCAVGDTYVIAGDVPHWGETGPEGATVIDVFAPGRADWESVPRLSAFPGGWPPPRTMSTDGMELASGDLAGAT